MRLKLIALSLLFVFLISFISVYAQETTTDVAETDVEIEQALEETTLSKEEVGLTPDKVGYGLKIALEKIRLALTLNKETRAKLALQLADKRIEEAKLMAKENKLEALARAKEEHRRLVLKARNNLEVSGESEQDLETQVGLESEIEKQETKLDDLENIVLIRARGLTEEQKQRLLALMEEFRNQNAEIKIKVSQNKLEIKTRLKAKGINETEIEEREAKFEENAERFANHQVDQAEKMFDLAFRLIEKVQLGETENETESSEKEEVKVNVEGEISQEAQVKLDELVEEIRARETGKIEIKIKAENNEVKTEVEGDLTENEQAKLDELKLQIESSSETEIEVEFEKELESKSSEKLTIKQETIELHAKAEAKLNEAKQALTDKKFKEAVELARESKKLSALTIASIRGIGKEIIDIRLEKIEEVEKIREERRELKEKVEERAREIRKKSLKEVKEKRDLLERELKEKRDLLKDELKGLSDIKNSDDSDKSRSSDSKENSDE